MTKKMTICALMLLCCFVTDADMIKSSVSMRENAMKNEQKSPNPYVTKGLVAMFDGEWNAGFFMHDPSSGTWKDLVGSNDLIVKNMVWGDTSLIGNNINKTYVPAYSPSCNMQILTVEVCVSGTKGCNFIIGNRAIILETYNGTISCGWYQRGKATYTDMTKPGTFSVIWKALESKEVDKCFKDAVSLDLSQGGTTQSSNGIVVGNGGGGAIDGQTYWNNLIGNVYCIRVYSRKLSDKEVLHNYLIDKERFGLE